MLRLAALPLLLAGTAHAQTDGRTPRAPSAREAADAGAFAPWTLGARAQTLVFVEGGYDAALGGAVTSGSIEAVLAGPLSLRAGASYAGPDGTLRPMLAGRVQALHQDRAGVDLSFVGGYEPQGFNQVPAVSLTAAIGRRAGDLALVANVGTGVGLEEGEAYGDARLAGLYRIARDLRVGLDGRFRIDLERDAIEPEGEPDWSVQTGPIAALTAGRYVVTGGVGVSALRYRGSDETHAGPIAQVGVGTVF